MKGEKTFLSSSFCRALLENRIFSPAPNSPRGKSSPNPNSRMDSINHARGQQLQNPKKAPHYTGNFTLHRCTNPTLTLHISKKNTQDHTASLAIVTKN